MSENKVKNKKALVIAISDYESSNLKSIRFCKNDGEEVFQVLKKLGYDIPDNRAIIGSVDSQVLRNAIYNFFTSEDNDVDDTLVFYYSGHGVPDKWGTNYLAPSNIDSDKPFLTGFSFDNLTNAMLECTSLNVVTILDSCYSGSLKISKGLDSKGGEDGMATIANSIVDEKSDKLNQGVGRCLLASSQGYEEAYDKEEKDHSIFTYFLLEGLNGNKDAVDQDGNVTYDTLGRFITKEFAKLPPNKRPKQTPVRKGEVSGTELILAEYPELRTLKEDYYSLFGRGEKYLRDNKFQDALECFNIILRTRPDDQDALLRKGYSLLITNMGKEAMDCFDNLIELNRSNSEAWYYKAQLHLQSKDYQAASKCLQQATDLSPNDERLWEIFKKVKSMLWSSKQEGEKDFVPQPEYLRYSKLKSEKDLIPNSEESRDLSSLGKENIIKEYDPIQPKSVQSQRVVEFTIPGRALISGDEMIGFLVSLKSFSDAVSKKFRENNVPAEKLKPIEMSIEGLTWEIETIGKTKHVTVLGKDNLRRNLENIREKISENIRQPEAINELLAHLDPLEKLADKDSSLLPTVSTPKKQGNINSKIHSKKNFLHDNKISLGPSDGYCVKCKKKRKMLNQKQLVMKNGRPAVSGVCSVCGTNMFKIGDSVIKRISEKTNTGKSRTETKKRKSNSITPRGNLETAYEWNRKGVSYHNQHRYARAIKAYDKALQLRPRLILPLFNKAQALTYLKKYEEALRYYNQVLKTKHSDAGMYMARGNCLVNMGRYREALKDYNQSLRIESESYDTLCEKANCLSWLERYGEAVRYYEKAIKLKPKLKRAVSGRNYAVGQLNNIKPVSKTDVGETEKKSGSPLFFWRKK